MVGQIMLACTEIIKIVEAREDLDQSVDQPGYMAATLEKVHLTKCNKPGSEPVFNALGSIDFVPSSKVLRAFFSFPISGSKNSQQKFIKSSPVT